MFEEFLFTWQERIRKLERPTAMSVKLQGEVDKYKVQPNRVDRISCYCQFCHSEHFCLCFDFHMVLSVCLEHGSHTEVCAWRSSLPRPLVGHVSLAWPSKRDNFRESHF